MKRFVLCVVLVALVGIASADTLIIYPSVDGRAYRASANMTYPDIRSDTGTGTNTDDSTRTSPLLRGQSTEGYFNALGRYISSYNTSVIPDTAIISEALISLKTRAAGVTNLGTPDFGITGGSLVVNTSLQNADYSRFNDIEYISRAAYPTTTGVRTNYTLNSAGISLIQGRITTSNPYTVFFGRDSWDIDNSFGGTWGSSAETSVAFYFVSAASESNRPYLSVVYTLADTTPPASITNLANVTTCQNITFTWDNPADADFGGIQYWINGTQQLPNLTNTTTGVLLESLAELTEYTFSTHTCDLTGNCNTTFVNLSSTTSECEVPPTPTPTAAPSFSVSFVANATCGNVPAAIQFTDTSTGTPATWNWSFGEGNYSDEQNPVFVFESLGKYDINLTANNTDSNGTLLKTDYIRIIPDYDVCPTPVASTGGSGSVYSTSPMPIVIVIGGIIMLFAFFGVKP